LRPHRHAIVCGLRTGESNNLKDSIVNRYGVLSCGRLFNERTNSSRSLRIALDHMKERVIPLMKFALAPAF